jgi:hypothetical protein
MFEGFKHLQLQTSDPQVTINLRYGGTAKGDSIPRRWPSLCVAARPSRSMAPICD